jgi:hypothetical protein
MVVSQNVTERYVKRAAPFAPEHVAHFADCVTLFGLASVATAQSNRGKDEGLA